MNTVHRDIFQAIHEGKWLSIEYHNKMDQITRYWIGIRDLNAAARTLWVEGLHLGKYSLGEFKTIDIDSILSSQLIEGSYYPVAQALVDDIHLNPHKYRGLFDQVANLKILNYLEDCNRLDTTPYKMDFALVRYLDRESFNGDFYPLGEERFQKIVKEFQVKADKKEEAERLGRKPVIQQLAMNVMSIHTSKGLYVLAYRKLKLDVKQRCLRPDCDITVCTEFTVDGTKESIRKYLDAEDYEFLQDFEGNQERIKDAITQAGRGKRNLAVNNAMKYPVAYIQGPPGTGKTNTIINTNTTAFFNERTVLFACYNNHPIDSVVEKLKSVMYRGKPILFPVVRLGNGRKVKQALADIKSRYEQAKRITVHADAAV